MNFRKIVPPLVSLVLALPLAAAASGNFRDVLDTPARASAYAAKSLLSGVANAGQRVVAVGQRGHIVYSDDGGQTWLQAKVPVSTDLTAVFFASPTHGWAVGHGGVVIVSYAADLYLHLLVPNSKFEIKTRPDCGTGYKKSCVS